jgi:threonylcarbamoyladenosine tRNA methylthiotransferase MtaB
VRGPAEGVPAAVADVLAGLGCRGGRPRDATAVRLRAFLRVQDGCSFRCAFCVIPQVRGATRSRPLEAVVAEAERRVAAGHRELVLTGVNLGLYRDREARVRLPGLVDRLARVEGLERLRLSSIEVDHVDDALLAALRRTASFLPHLHVPLQSGSDDVLARMRRRYGRDRYLARIERAREALGDLHVTADVIVGYPGEGDDDFAQTLDVVRRAGLGRVHAFPYSPRPGTATAGEDDVPPPVKRRRSEAVRALADRQGAERRAARVGRRDRVLVERHDANGVLHGYGRDYTPWRLAPAAAAAGDIVDVVAVGSGPDGMEGRIA